MFFALLSSFPEGLDDLTGAVTEPGVGDALAFPFALSDSRSIETERVSRLGDSTVSPRGAALTGVEVLELSVEEDIFAFCERVDIIERKGVEGLLIAAVGSVEDGTVDADEALRFEEPRPGVDGAVLLVVSEGAREDKSDPGPKSAVSSISPSAGTSDAFAKGLILSSSLSSLSSLLSKAGLETA